MTTNDDDDEDEEDDDDLSRLFLTTHVTAAALLPCSTFLFLLSKNMILLTLSSHPANPRDSFSRSQQPQTFTGSATIYPSRPLFRSRTPRTYSNKLRTTIRPPSNTRSPPQTPARSHG